MELILELVKVGESGPHDNTPKRVANHRDPRKLVARAVLSDELEDLLAEAVAHFADVTIRLAFISRRLEEDGLR